MCCFQVKRERQTSTHKIHGMCSYAADFLLIVIVLLYLGVGLTDTGREIFVIIPTESTE